jgi:hypothetical protein
MSSLDLGQRGAMPILKAGAGCLALVFGAAFLLGTIRVPWVVERLGTRTAELLEAPVILAVTVLVAWWVSRRTESDGRRRP